MPTALQTPLNSGKATKVGKRLYRKQVLPVGSVEHEGHKLDFTKPRLQKIAANFTAGKMDQVPFKLVEDGNKHGDDPERVRGEMTGVELADDGLYGIFEMTEDGAKLIDSNTKLGVSARLADEGTLLKHVAGTLDPVAKGMKAWEALNLSDDGDTIIDLSDGVFAVLSDTDNKPSGVSTDALTDKDLTALKALADKLAAKDGDSGEKPDIDKLAAELLADEKADDKEPVALSAKDQATIDLATKTAKDASDRADNLAAQLANAEWDKLRREFVLDGVPPAMLNLAAPHLSKASTTIDLSNSSSTANAMLKMLEEARGTVDLAERGRGDEKDEDEAKRGKDLADAWHKAMTGAAE